MKTLVYKDLSGEEFIYNDDTGMIFPYDDKLLNLMQCKNNKPNCYMDKYYSNLIEKLQSMIVRTPSNLESIESHLQESGFSQITLKVTEQCNMRCEYCIYSEHYPDTKYYSDVYMEWETAKKAIDDYLAHFYHTWKRNNGRKPVIAFYGGEPLLGFNIIKKTVLYVEACYSQYKFNYTITTNGLLLSDDEISEFLKQHGFWIIVSIDGTKRNHDRYRITRNGKPTYDYIMNIVDEKFSDYDNIFSVCCYDVTSDLLELTEFYEEMDRRKGGKFPPVLRASRINSAFTDFYDNVTNEQFAEHQRQIEILRNKYLDCILNDEAPPIFISLLFSQIFISISERLKFIANNPFYCCSCASCVPGDRLCVESNGVYKICEKTNMQGLEMGTCDEGFNLDLVKNAVCQYNEYILKKCKECNCSRICSLCYASIKTSPTLELDGKNFCKRTKEFLVNCLAAYTSIAKKKRFNLPKGIEGMSNSSHLM